MDDCNIERRGFVAILTLLMIPSHDCILFPLLDPCCSQQALCALRQMVSYCQLLDFPDVEMVDDNDIDDR